MDEAPPPCGTIRAFTTTRRDVVEALAMFDAVAGRTCGRTPLGGPVRKAGLLRPEPVPARLTALRTRPSAAPSSRLDLPMRIRNSSSDKAICGIYRVAISTTITNIQREKERITHGPHKENVAHLFRRADSGVARSASHGLYLAKHATFRNRAVKRI